MLLDKRVTKSLLEYDIWRVFGRKDNEQAIKATRTCGILVIIIGLICL